VAGINISFLKVSKHQFCWSGVITVRPEQHQREPELGRNDLEFFGLVIGRPI
jgi:hypothetical protein